MKKKDMSRVGFLVFVIVLWALSFGELDAQSKHSFVTPDFEVPEKLETEKFLLRMLTVNDVVKDYDAVMTSVEHLRGAFGPHSTWPSPNLTLEQDLIDLGWHQKEFQLRRSFTYTVMNPSESQCLGCVYIHPTRKQRYDAEVYLWVRKSEFVKGLDPILFDTVKKWVEKEWPFKNVAYPGREIDWKAWEAHPEQ
jgi:hypothetical protein